MKKQVNVWLCIAFSYLCGIAYPFVLSNVLSYAIWFAVTWSKTNAPNPMSKWVITSSLANCLLIFAFFAIVFLLLVALNVFLLVLARRLGMDRPSTVMWWISIAFGVISALSLTVPLYFALELENADNVIYLSWLRAFFPSRH